MNEYSSGNDYTNKLPIEKQLNKYVKERFTELFDVKKAYTIKDDEFSIDNGSSENENLIKSGLEEIQNAIQEIQRIKQDGFNYIINTGQVSEELTEQHKIRVDNELYTRINPIISQTFKKLPESWKRLILFNVIGTQTNDDKNLIYKDKKICINSQEKKLSIKIVWSDALMNFILLLPTSIGFYDKVLEKQENKLESALGYGKKFYYEDLSKHTNALSFYYNLFLTSRNPKYHEHINDYHQEKAYSHKEELAGFFEQGQEVKDLLNTHYVDDFNKQLSKKHTNPRIKDNKEGSYKIADYFTIDAGKNIFILILLGIIIKQNFSSIPYVKNIRFIHH